MPKKQPSKSLLKIRGARVHNLKNINLEIPKDALVVFTGVSGSGKSSLVFDTIYAEGQRRYVESLSAYARQFLGIMEKPDVDAIEGISPAIAIDQKSVSRNPRSTVGTITEIYDYLRLLFARVGTPYCPDGHGAIAAQTQSQIKDQVVKLRGELFVLAPLVQGKKGEHQALLEEVQEQGFSRVRIDGHIVPLENVIEEQPRRFGRGADRSVGLDPKKKHRIEVVVDHFTISPKEELDKIRISDSVETALKIGKGMMIVLGRPGLPSIRGLPGSPRKKKDIRDTLEEIVFSERFSCSVCGFSAAEIEPRTFSFNNPYGACPTCSGLGTKMEADPDLIIPNKRLSLAEGAVRPWMNASHRLGRQGWFWYILRGLADKHHFSVSVPVKDLSQNALELVLHGDEEFEGVVPNLERRYKETDSEWTRAEIEKYMNIRLCPVCLGKRLNPVALSVLIAGKSIYDITSIAVGELENFFDFSHTDSIASMLTKEQEKIARQVIKEIANRLHFLERVGLSYLTLARSSTSLSGGEAQRIRLATQLGSYLSGVLYILDEPSIGLHARDQAQLIETMKELRDLGNSVLVVEHDPFTIREADVVVDVGPGAGKHGGNITFVGMPQELMKDSSETGQYLSGRKKVHIKKLQISNLKSQKYLSVKGATEHNLKNFDVKIPLEKFVCVTGVSGSGKSTLVNDIIAKSLLKTFHYAHVIPGAHKKIEGTSNLDKAIVVDQSPIGRTPRSNPATYTGSFMIIRDLFARTQEAKIRGYSAGRFSFNVKGGRCEACQGAGVKKVEMFFLPDIYVECDECGGKRYTKEALEIQYRGKTIDDVLNMTIGEAAVFFKDVPQLTQKLSVLERVGLGYIELGQPAPSLSGGEAQRVKLATELSRRDTGKTLYILDEPTTGLHFSDVQNLLNVLAELVARKNTILVIEHNMDVIRNADWVIDLGPEGGDAGGYIVVEGTPEQIAKNKKSYTGQYLR